jgi:hypothetical protein
MRWEKKTDEQNHTLINDEINTMLSTKEYTTLKLPPTLKNQEHYLLVKVINRVLYELDDLVHSYIHNIHVVIEPLFKVKNKTPPTRKSTLRQLTDGL